MITALIVPDHPRYPYRMPAGVQEAVADEVRVTLAAFPTKERFASIDHAITAYAEQLRDDFAIDEIRQGFRNARVQATSLAPTPSQVRARVAEVRRVTQELPPDESSVVTGEVPDWVHRFHAERLDAPPVYLGREER